VQVPVTIGDDGSELFPGSEHEMPILVSRFLLPGGGKCTVSISAPREKGFSRARLTLFFITIGFWRCEWGQSGTEKRESGLSPSAQPVRDGCHQVRNSLSPNAQHFPEWRPPRHHRRAGFILYIEVGKVPGAQEETPAYSPQSIS
jgi:hypothetical protein